MATPDSQGQALKVCDNQGSSQRSQGVAGRYALTVDVSVPLRLQKRRYAFENSMSSFCWSFLPSVSRSQAGVKYMKHVARLAMMKAMRVSHSSTSVVSFQVRVYPATALCCGACHVNVKPKFTEGKSSLKLHTRVERRGKHSTTDQDICIKIDLAQDSEGWGWTVRSVTPADGAWRDHSFLVTFLRLEELKMNSATYFVCLFL